jgi:hypothetical protein
MSLIGDGSPIELSRAFHEYFAPPQRGFQPPMRA